MEQISTPIGSYAPDFELPGIDGAVHHLARYLEQYQAIAVIIMCNHCLYVTLYLDRLKQLQADLAGQGVTLVGINSNDDSRYPDDSFEKMKQFAEQHQLNFPYLRDVTQDVARSFGAERTPEAFLLDRMGVIQYHGLIDDNAQNPSAVKTPYLRDAIAALLAGNLPHALATAAIGCSVKWRQ